MSIFSKLLRVPPGGVGRVVVGKKPEDQNKTGIPVTAAIFFDGTGNNRNNVAQGNMGRHNQKHPDAPMQQENDIRWSGSYNKHGQKSDSYSGGYSNVSILERLNLKRRLAQQDISVYVEGIGTLDDDADATKGGALGKGVTGIKAKVTRGVGLIAHRITQILTKQIDTFVEQITIDVFGFSRGAAAARHFVSLLNDAIPLAARLGVPDAQVTIKFLGVFDTVSSMGLRHDDVEELGLRVGSNAQKVVHLTAAHEYRVNFSLTDITSSLGNGYELTLPGAHSDIGGGYMAEEKETRPLYLEDRPLLLAQGWYTETEAPIQSEDIYDPESGQKMGTRQWAVGTRLAVRHDYQFIPLAIMAACAEKQSLELEALRGRFAKYSISSDHVLAPIQAAIQTHVDQHGASGRHVLTLPDEQPAGTALDLSMEQLRLLRGTFLHRSASNQGLGFGLGLNLFNDGRTGMGERRKDGKPYRHVYAG